MDRPPVTSLCFVCLGNICRSPTAEGVMLHLVAQAGLAERFAIESAGTAAYHVGERPDPRTLEVARRHGVALPSYARRIERGDLARFDHVIAMDRSNLSALHELVEGRESRATLHLLRQFEPGASSLDVPDPYYGGGHGFEEVFQICMRACSGLLDWLAPEAR